MTAAGDANFGALQANWSFRVNNGTAGTVAGIIKGAASQTADLQQWLNNSGAVLAKVDASGSITAPNILSPFLLMGA